MTIANIVQSTFDQFAKTLGARKKSGSWYLAGPDSIVVLNLQKSSYSSRYYINIGVWFTGLGLAKDPKPTHCHLQARAETLLEEADRPRLEELLAVGNGRAPGVHERELLEALSSQVRPYVEAGQTLVGLTTSVGKRLLAKSLLDGDGQRLLASQGLWL
ncbi:MAG: DUF4304 domain-containing protein [Actinomycetales bacterium]|nr:DUF4304 domain-containing protein [Actinomycetales bacterium]HBX78473.1 hypothetical protein [Acidimicrobiaceae bacterium]